jgi:hypothetical protein
MAASLLGPTTTPSASSALAAQERPHLLHLPQEPPPPFQHQHQHQLLDSPVPSPPLPESQPRPHPQPHTSHTSHPPSLSPQRRPLPPSPSSSPPPPPLPRDDSLYTFAPDHARSSSSVASSVTAVEPLPYRSSCPITRHYNGPAVLAAIVSLTEPALLRSRASSGSLSRAPRRLPPSPALAEAAALNKMHQTSSRLLRMTSDDRPFTRVSRPGAGRPRASGSPTLP